MNQLNLGSEEFAVLQKLYQLGPKVARYRLLRSLVGFTEAKFDQAIGKLKQIGLVTCDVEIIPRLKQSPRVTPTITITRRGSTAFS